MSSGKRRTFGVGIALLAIGATARLGTGCSDDPAAAARHDAAVDAPAVVPRPASPATDGASKTCREECEAAHGAGQSKDEAIGSCWETHCAAACIQQTPVDAGSDAGVPDAGTCSQPVVTPSEDCDTCTRTFCCAEWDGCFGDEACTALNACYQTCIQ